MDAACSQSFRANRAYKCVSFAALTGATAKDDQETLHDLSLSRSLARKFDLVARQRHGAKSAIVEEAIRVQLEQPQHPGIEEGMARRLDDLDKTIATVGRDVAILAETLALFVRYFLTITPVLPESEQESARRLGRERFEVFVPQVGQRLLGTFASYRKSSRPSPYTNRASSPPLPVTGC